MLAWLGGKRKLLEAAKAKGANASGFGKAPKQPSNKSRSYVPGQVYSRKRTSQHSVQQPLQDGPVSQRNAPSNKRLRVASSTQSMDMLMCNGVQHTAEMHEPAAVAASLGCSETEPHATKQSTAAETAAPPAAGYHASTTAKHVSSSIGTASVQTPNFKPPIPSASQVPAAASSLPGSIRRNAAVAAAAPPLLPIALAASALERTTAGNSDATKHDAVAAAVQPSDWHAVLLGTSTGANNHQHAAPGRQTSAGAQQQDAANCAEAQEAHMQHAAGPAAPGARQQRSTQQLASFDLMFLQGHMV
jgi:hypothetical protein